MQDIICRGDTYIWASKWAISAENHAANELNHWLADHNKDN